MAVKAVISLKDAMADEDLELASKSLLMSTVLEETKIYRQNGRLMV